MKNLFQNRAVGFWLDLAGTVLTLVGIILYALYAADTGSNNVWVYIGLGGRGGRCSRAGNGQ